MPLEQGALQSTRTSKGLAVPTQPNTFPESPLGPWSPKTLDALLDYILDYVQTTLQHTGK